MTRRILTAMLLAVCVVSPLGEARGQTGQSPDEVVRGFYGWYLGRLEKDDWRPLDNRREALKYLTPGWRAAAPRVSGEQGVNVFVCAQDWVAEWRKSMKFGAAAVRGAKATVRVTWSTGADTQRIDVTLRKAAGAWKIERTACVL